MNETQVVEELNTVIADKTVDEVLVALPIDKYGSLVQTIVRQCEEQGIIVRVRTEMTTCTLEGPMWMNTGRSGHDDPVRTARRLAARCEKGDRYYREHGPVDCFGTSAHFAVHNCPLSGFAWAGVF